VDLLLSDVPHEPLRYLKQNPAPSRPVGAASLSQMRMKWARRCFGASVLLGLVASVGLSGCSHAAVPGLPRVSRGLVPGRNGPRRLHHVTWPAQRHRRRPGAHRRGTTALPRPRTRLGVSRYATRVAHIRPDDGARRETISVGSHRRLPSCFGDLARVRHYGGVSQWDGQAAVPDDLHRRLLPVALDGPAGQHRRDAYLLGWVKGYLPAPLAHAVALSLVR